VQGGEVDGCERPDTGEHGEPGHEPDVAGADEHAVEGEDDTSRDP